MQRVELKSILRVCVRAYVRDRVQVFDSIHIFDETWRTSTVHVRGVYSEGSRVVGRLVKIDFWGKPFRE